MEGEGHGGQAKNSCRWLVEAGKRPAAKEVSGADCATSQVASTHASSSLELV